MRRNETKRMLLETAEDFGKPAEPGLFETWLEYEYSTSLSPRAVKMGLLRCHRQGLLSRRGGRYLLTEKGAERLTFLRSTVQ